MVEVNQLTWEKLWELFYEIYEPKVIRTTTTKQKATVTLDTGRLGGRTFLEIWISTSGPATFVVEASMDGERWRTIKTLEFSGSGEHHEGFFNAARYIRISGGDGNDNTIEIWASR